MKIHPSTAPPLLLLVLVLPPHDGGRGRGVAWRWGVGRGTLPEGVAGRTPVSLVGGLLLLVVVVGVGMVVVGRGRWGGAVEDGVVYSDGVVFFGDGHKVA